MTSIAKFVMAQLVPVFFLCFLALFSRDTDAIVVTTLSGKIKGFTETVSGSDVDIYLGVPFAKPPLGDLRFRAPQPVEEWSGMKDALTLPNCCMQYPDTMFDRFRGVEVWNPNTEVSEDCLYLNLWVPKTAGGEKLATIVWIYGGSFVYGSSTLDIYNGKTFAAKNKVIVASMNYRMGVQGFLYSGTADAPGNMGLLDQQMAMRWVHENIATFGGDPDKITLLGESAGAASVSHHLLASSSWPYYNNAIMLSGSSLSEWSTMSQGKLLNKLYALANVMDCGPRSPSNEQGRSARDQIIDCLKDADAATLELKQWEIQNGDIGTFLPVVDGTFLPATPQELLSSGRVKDANIIAGNTKDEGEFFLVYFYQDVIKPENLWTPKQLNRSEFEDIVRRIGDFKSGLELESILYTYEDSILPVNRQSYMDILDDILGDYAFKCPVHELASQFSSQDPAKGRTYVYSFDYRHSANPWPGWMGALHGYEIEMVFGLPFNPRLNYSSNDRVVSEHVMAYFATFAKTGSPNSLGSGSPRWPEFSAARQQHVVFTQGTNVVVKDDFRNKECSFWRDFFPKIHEHEEQIRQETSACDSILPWTFVLIASAMTSISLSTRLVGS